MTEADLVLGDGRTLHVYDTAPGEADARLVVFWHHGTPNLGAPPEPLLPGAADHLASSAFDPEQFTPADRAALAGPWSWLGDVAEQALEGGLGGMVDDDLAYVAPWGFDPGQIRTPALFLHGGQDRIAPSAHGRWLSRHTRSAELWLRPDDGHISVLTSGAAALGWLRERASRR